MTEEKMVEVIIEHDQALKTVAKAIDTLAEEAKQSNMKLDSIVVSMSKQELILEKITNIENRTKDSFNRVHARIKDIKQVQDVGCTPLQLSIQNSSAIASRVDKVEKHIIWISRTLIGAMVTGSIGLLFYLVKG